MCGVLEYNEYLFQNHCSHRHPVKPGVSLSFWLKRQGLFQKQIPTGLFIFLHESLIQKSAEKALE